MWCFKEVVTFFTDQFVWSRSDNSGPSRVYEGDVVVDVNRHDRGGDGVEVLYFFVSGLLLFGFVCDVEHIFNCAFDVAFGVFNRCSCIFYRDNNPIFWPGNGLFGDHRVGFHGSCTGAFVGFTVGSLEQVVAFFSNYCVRGGAYYCCPCRVHEGN